MEAFLHDMSWAVAIRAEWLTPIMLGFTALGYTTFFLIALPVLYWSWDKSATTRLALIIFASALLMAFLKDLWQDPRPDVSLWLDPHMDDSYGRPSGHTLVGIVMWCWLAYEINKVWAWIAGIVIAAGIAFSRLYLGVHDVDDVLVGGVLGIAVIFLYQFLLSPRMSWWHDLPFIARLGGLALAGVAVLALYPGEAAGAATIVGMFLGWYAGFAGDKRFIDFAPGAWWARIIVAVLGTLAVIQLFEGLSAFQEAIAPQSVALGVLTGAIMGAFIALVIPGIGTLARLMKREG